MPLWAAGPERLSIVVGNYEHQLMSDPQVDLAQPFLSLTLYNPDIGEHVLYPIQLPYDNDTMIILGGTKRRGQLGRFVSNLAGIFAQVPPQVLRDSLPEWTPGLRLLFAALGAETVHVHGPVADEVTDYERDIPAERQHHVRNLIACDGRGFMYQTTRPDTGVTGPANMMCAPCQADPDRFGFFLHQASGPRQERVTGGVPWGLDVLARAARRAFESGGTGGTLAGAITVAS